MDGCSAGWFSRLPAAGRYSLLLMGCLYVLGAGATALFVLARGGSAVMVIHLVAGPPVWIGFATGTTALIVLLVFVPRSTLWGLASRAAVASYLGIAAPGLVRLLTREWLPASPGATGGFAVVAIPLVAFTLLGGPVWVGTLAVLLRRAAGQLQPPPVSAVARQRRLGASLLVAGALAALMTVLTAYVAAAYGGMDYKCLVEGPRSPLAEVSERSDIVSGRFSLWPLGRACEWARADGNGWVTATPDNWAGTVGVLVASAVALLGAGLLWSAARSDRAAAPATDPD